MCISLVIPDDSQLDELIDVLDDLKEIQRKKIGLTQLGLRPCDIEEEIVDLEAELMWRQS